MFQIFLVPQKWRAHYLLKKSVNIIGSMLAGYSMTKEDILGSVFPAVDNTLLTKQQYISVVMTIFPSTLSKTTGWMHHIFFSLFFSLSSLVCLCNNYFLGQVLISPRTSVLHNRTFVGSLYMIKYSPSFLMLKLIGNPAHNNILNCP